MKILFVHTNFPAQFGAFGTWLAEQGWDVAFATARKDAKAPEGCRLYRFDSVADGAPEAHRHARGFDRAVTTGEKFAAASIKHRDAGYYPDIIVAHSGWGAGTYAKAVWPDARYVAYLEWWYTEPRPDRHPDEEIPDDMTGSRAKAISRNGPSLLDISVADGIMCPTEFQASTFPDWIRERITVLHDGIDVAANAPNADARQVLTDQGMPEDAEIVTYATRGMEPYRGFPEFMRAVALLQERRPRMFAIIVGDDRVAYGAQLPKGESWRQRMLEELDLDHGRLVFPGHLPLAAYRLIVQASDAHCYLTIPFVLSWSFMESMSMGAPIVASNVAPVREIVGDTDVAKLVDHHDVPALADAIESLLVDRAAARAQGNSARRMIEARYNRDWIWPARADWLSRLVS